jgi:predicted ATPase with chaperone activity
MAWFLGFKDDIADERRTIVELELSDNIESIHLAEAIQYREGLRYYK